MLTASILALALGVSVEVSNDSWPDTSTDDLDTFGADVTAPRWGLSWHILTDREANTRTDEARAHGAPFPEVPWLHLGLYAQGNLGGEAAQQGTHELLHDEDRSGMVYDTFKFSAEVSAYYSWRWVDARAHVNFYNSFLRVWAGYPMPKGWGRLGPFVQGHLEYGEDTTVGRVRDKLGWLGARWESAGERVTVTFEGTDAAFRGGLRIQF